MAAAVLLLLLLLLRNGSVCCEAFLRIGNFYRKIKTNVELDLNHIHSP